MTPPERSVGYGVRDRDTDELVALFHTRTEAEAFAAERPFERDGHGRLEVGLEVERIVFAPKLEQGASMRQLWRRFWAWRAHRHYVLSERYGRRAGLRENPY